MIAFTKVNKAKASDVETTEAPDLPPGYKRTEVGVIHEEWTTHPLCNDILLFSGHHVLALNCNTRGDGTPYVTGPADFPEGQIKQTKFTTKPTTLCRAGDILITVKGSGSGTIVEADAEYCISRQLMAIRTTTWEPTFLMYSLLQNASRIKAASTGLIPGLSRSDILGQAIPLPKDPSEQRAIAEVLSDVDGLLGALEALIAKKRGIKQAAMQQLLTGKTRLPGFSGEWVTTTLGEAADIKNGATPSTQITAFWNGSIPWCTPTDITNTPGKYLLTTERSITAEGLVNCAASLLPAGALLLCSRATIGEIKIAASPVCTNQGFKSLICKDGVSDEFLYYLLVTLKPQMIERAIGSTFLEIGKRDVAAIEVSLPPCNEQHAIASILCDVDAKIAALERRRIKTRAIKQGMMQQLLTGQIRLVTPEKSGTDGSTMTPLRIFISSVQKEFSHEREALCDYLRGDPMMRRFFDVFLFEDAPASDRRPDELYLDEVERCDLYVGLFGNDYGTEDGKGVSPTEQEFDRATAIGAHRLIFVKETDAGARHPKMKALIGKAQAGLIRKRFNTPEGLVTGLYAALVEYLEGKELIRWGPFDAAPCMKAVLGDLDFKRMARFIRTARRARQFPLTEDAAPEELLEHLNLSNDGRPTNAAVLLFGKAPQRFLISSEIKCAHFHGTEVAKPIPSYQVYKGTAFDLVDQAVDFVLSKIALSVGTRAKSVRAPVTSEIPKEVVTEAIVNAVAHRDYTNRGSVQVMLFADRLEVWNPGRLSPPLTLEKLRVAHASIPGNPLLAESLYLAEYIERMGTGTLDMIRRCVEAGLKEPEFSVTDGFVTTVWRVSVVTAYCDRNPISNVDVLVLFPNGTWKRSTTDERGEAHIEMHARNLPLTVFAAAEGFAGHIERDWMPAERTLSLELKRLASGGAVIFPEATGDLPRLRGRLNPIRDVHDRTYLYTSNIAVNDGQPQPVHFVLGEELHLTDADGNELLARIVDVVGRSALVEYRATQGQSGSQPESRPESRPESLEAKVLTQLAGKPLSKAELSKNLGQKEISGQLNKVIRKLLADRMIEYTLPDRPRSRLQKYRLTAKGKAAIASLRAEGSER